MVTAYIFHYSYIVISIILHEHRPTQNNCLWIRCHLPIYKTCDTTMLWTHVDKGTCWLGANNVSTTSQEQADLNAAYLT